jgi:periplasmic protein CpxP/Spy
MRAIVAVLATTFVIGSAYAAGPATDSSGSAATQPDATHDLKVDNHIKALHAELKITAAEESQWNTVAQTMRENARELDQAIDKRDAIVGSATAIDNLNSYADVAQAHADGVRKLATAFSGLYSSMSDDQKKEADEQFGHRSHAGKKIAKE